MRTMNSAQNEGNPKAPPVLLGGRAVPSKSFKLLWHVGSLQAADKGRQGASQEGSGLSVSIHPEDWATIARLGGYPTWDLHRQANRFLAFHKLSKVHREALQSWGVTKDYLIFKQQWKLQYYDSELDDECHCLFDTEEEARKEIPDWLDESEPATVSEVTVPCPTALMAERLGFDTRFCDAMDMVATFWVEDETSLDGVWWQDTYAPESLSAPRGVIVRRAIPQWSITQ